MGTLLGEAGPQPSWLRGLAAAVAGVLVGRSHSGVVPGGVGGLGGAGPQEHAGVDEVDSASKVEGESPPLVPTSARPAGQNECKKNGTLWDFHSWRKFIQNPCFSGNKISQ